MSLVVHRGRPSEVSYVLESKDEIQSGRDLAVGRTVVVRQRANAVEPVKPQLRPNDHIRAGQPVGTKRGFVEVAAADPQTQTAIDSPRGV